MIFQYCPKCKHDLTAKDNREECPNCGFIHYHDMVACASVVPVKDDKVLINIRRDEPYKGQVDLIGGFIEPGETAEHAAVREAKEETGLDVKIVKMFGTYADQYGKDGVYTMNIQFIVEITGGEMKASDDAAALEWIDIKEIPNIKFEGFKNTEDTLKDLHKEFVK